MSKEICISSTPHETRLAILEDDQLTEVYYERENEYTLAGSIYKGRVTRVFQGCSRHSSTWAWSATLFSMSRISWRSRKTLPTSSEFRRTAGTRRAQPGNRRPGRTASRVRHPRKKKLHGATAPRRVREGQHRAKPRQASLRMGPGAGVAGVAAARAFAHNSKVGSRQLRNRRRQPAPR